ncbi:MAG TPA: metal-dependent transcriptional regulator [Candidatus Bilamarchaeum sp.]|nr:metal-dependent transcriptional regulator [Candidatus Bilamarchaeum sp.]
MLSRISENYLRVISEIVEKKGYARPADIAKTLCISPASVTEMMQKLAREGLVNYEKRGAVTLTGEGSRRASAIKMRYQVFLKLFEMAGVSSQTAYMDACYVEHHLSEETVSKLVDFVQRLERGESVLSNKSSIRISFKT